MFSYRHNANFYLQMLKIIEKLKITFLKDIKQTNPIMGQHSLSGGWIKPIFFCDITQPVIYGM